MSRSVVGFLFCLLALLNSGAIAQGASFTEANILWSTVEVSNYCIGGSNLHNHWYNRLSGDTIIGQHNYRLLVHEPKCKYANEGTHCSSAYFPAPFDSLIVGGFREDSSRLYFLKFNIDQQTNYQIFDKGIQSIPANTEILVYDLNWEVGDSVLYPLNSTNLIYDVFNVQTWMGRKRIGLQRRGSPQGVIYSALEGVGGLYCLFGMYFSAYYDKVLQCATVNGESIFNPYLEFGSCEFDCSAIVTSNSQIWPDHIRIYPSPASERVFIDADNDSQVFVARLFNAGGQLVKSIEAFTDQTMIEVDDLMPGLYTVVLLSPETASFARKIVIH